MADTITIRTDDETEHALDLLTRDGSSRSAAIRQAVLEAARRRERAAESCSHEQRRREYTTRRAGAQAHRRRA